MGIEKMGPNPEIMRGPEVSADSEKTASPEIREITEKDLRVVVPEVGETALILQRNAKDERTPGAENYGTLTPEASEKTRRDARAYFEKVLRSLNPDERGQVDILIVASDARLVAPEGKEFNSSHKRALETAAEVMRGAQEAMKELGVPESQLLNLLEFAEESEPEGPVEFTDLEALKMLSKSPEFVKYLREKYGTGKKFWANYEQDTDRETREQMGAEGVYGIAERMRSFLTLLKQGALERHQRLPQKRLIIWAVSHYDAISPFVKVNVLDRPATDYLPIAAGGGVTLEIDKGGKAKTEIGQQKFDVKI